MAPPGNQAANGENEPHPKCCEGAGLLSHHICRHHICEKLNPTQLAKELKTLENKMLEHAHNLEFEQAAQVRDQINLIQSEMLGLGSQ